MHIGIIVCTQGVLATSHPDPATSHLIESFRWNWHHFICLLRAGIISRTHCIPCYVVAGVSDVFACFSPHASCGRWISNTYSMHNCASSKLYEQYLCNNLLVGCASQYIHWKWVRRMAMWKVLVECYEASQQLHPADRYFRILDVAAMEMFVIEFECLHFEEGEEEAHIARKWA